MPPAGCSGAALAAVGLTSFGRTAPAAGEAAPPAVAGAAKPLPAYVGWTDPASPIVHSSTTIETKRSVFGTSVITPSERLYIRNNLPAPNASILGDRDTCEINNEGVNNPRKLTLGDLQRLGIETTAMVLQYSGNGRGYFPSKPSGTP